MEKESAYWIYYEEGHIYYCYDCCMKRVQEINKNREFADCIDYEDGEECSYMEDVADQDYGVECEKCGKPLCSEYDYKSDEEKKKLSDEQNQRCGGCAATGNFY